ncbi:MAG: hypothetical protein WCK27_31635 [Verrucomicrobiota bacterium]
MKILPRSGSAWLAMWLVPFKVFVPAGYLMVVIQREVLGYRMDTGAITPFILGGYILSFLVLVLGASIQRSLAPRRAYLSTCAFAAGVFLFGFLLLPYLAHP